MIRVLARGILLVSLITLPGIAQSPRTRLPFDPLLNESVESLIFGGSGNDSINAAAVDSDGDIYVVGTTTSFDFPLAHAYQGANSGTQLVVSRDAGATWQPLATPFPSPITSVSIATDPTNSQIVYTAYGNSVCRSTDGGHQFGCVTVAFASFQTIFTSLAVDPQQPLTVYASATTNGGVFKSVDGGETWTNSSQGLPSQGFIFSVVIDPFHPNVLYAWADFGGFVSTDGAVSWTQSGLPWPQNTTAPGNFTFDPVTPGVIYGPSISGSQSGLQKSTDGGATWTQLNTPFIGSNIVPDPKVSGLLYAVAPPINAQSASFPFWRSADGGATWTSYPSPADSLSVLAVDPANPQIMLLGPFRSTDGGQSWSPTNLSRDVQPAFAPSSAGLVYAIAPITSDAFLAKFLPDGKTLVFSTYFGGMGDDTGRGIALDGSGDIWITGNTSSYDLPVTPGALEGTLHGEKNAYAAKFSNDGRLLAATYLGGSGSDSGLGVKIDPQGNPWLIGNWSSADFPFTTTPPATLPVTPVGFVSKLDPSATRLLYSASVGAPFDTNGKGIAIDSSGNVTLTGSVWGAFPVTPGAYQAGDADPNAPKAFVLKLTPPGGVIYSTFFGGTAGSPTTGNYQPTRDYGVAVAVDEAGNAYLTGNTDDTDFPTTPGAYQTTLAAGCTYPAISIYTGFIGSILQWYVDDVFVIKLSPDGKTALFSTLLGGACYDRPTSIALDAVGRIYVAGETDSEDFPVVGAVEPAPLGSQFASFVSALDPAGSALTFSTYLYAGSDPTVVAGPGRTIHVAGATGTGAQTSALVGCFTGPCPPTTAHGNLVLIKPRERSDDRPPGPITRR